MSIPKMKAKAKEIGIKLGNMKKKKEKKLTYSKRRM